MLAVIPLGLSAQTAKFGHVNSQKLLEVMPEVKAANAKLDTLNHQYTNELKALAEEYKAKLSSFQNLPPSTSDAIKNNKMKELQDMQDRIQQFQEQAQDDLQKKNEEYFAPIQTKVKDAIKAVAKDGGFNYIFDASSAALLYAADSEDVTALVKKKLGIK